MARAAVLYSYPSVFCLILVSLICFVAEPRSYAQWLCLITDSQHSYGDEYVFLYVCASIVCWPPVQSQAILSNATRC